MHRRRFAAAAFTSAWPGKPARGRSSSTVLALQAIKPSGEMRHVRGLQADGSRGLARDCSSQPGVSGAVAELVRLGQMNQLAKSMCFAVLLGLTGCLALNQDWTQKPATKTDYVPGQHYQLLTNVFFSFGRQDFVLSRKILGDSDSMLDAGTRLRVTTVHYNGDSFETGFFTTVRAEAATGPFKGTNFDISFLSNGSHAFIARNPTVVVPVDASAPDLNTNHFAWAVVQITDYRGEYTWDWWKRAEKDPGVVLPVRFLLQQKQNCMFLVAFQNAATAEAKAYALAALKMLNEPAFPSLANQLIAINPTINTYYKGNHAVEPTATVIARMQQDVEIFYPGR